MLKVIRAQCKILFIAICLFLGMTVVCNAETLPDYDADKTISYAKQHCMDSKEPGATKADCIEFARTCVQQGGVPKDTARVFKNGTGYTVEGYVNYMVESGYAELNKLVKRTYTDYYGKQYQYVHQDDNEGLVAPGDIIIYKCTNKKCDKGYYHASICAAPDEDGTYAGFYRHYAHNTSVDNKLLCTIKCFDKTCKSEEDLYALHITSEENGYAEYNDKVKVSVKCTAYNKLKISWKAAPGAESYHVFYKKSKNAFYEELTSTEKTSVTYTVPKTHYGAITYFVVRPCKEIDGKTLIGAQSNQGTGYTTAGAPKNVKLNLTNYRSVKVTWGKTNGATGYKVEYQPKGSKKWVFLCWTTKTSASLKNMAEGKQYTFKITPYTSSKNYSGKRLSTKFATGKVTALKHIYAPTVKRVSAKKVSVKWANIDGETGYEISYSAKKGKDGKIVTVKSSTAKTKTLSIPKGKKYYYKIRAYKLVNGKRVYAPWSGTRYV